MGEAAGGAALADGVRDVANDDGDGDGDGAALHCTRTAPASVSAAIRRAPTRDEASTRLLI